MKNYQLAASEKNEKHIPFFYYSIIIFFLFFGSIKYASAQPHSSGLGLIYAYGGATFANVSTSAFFDANISGVNTTLDLEKDLNFPSSSKLAYMRALAGGRLQVAASYMSLHRNGESSLTRTFAFGDSVYEVGAKVNGFFNTDYYSATLRFSVLRNEIVTAGISLGGRYMKLDAGIDARTGGFNFKRDGNFDLPLFVPGIHGSVHVLPKLLVRGSLEYFAIKISDTRGKVLDAQISAEIYVLKNLGAGLGYSVLEIDAQDIPENDLYLKDVNYNINGIFMYAAFRF